MATNHTTNYQLNLWEPGDKFVRSEFNENTSKIDAALAAHENRLNAKADAAAVSALQTAVAGKADAAALAQKISIVTGTYTGSYTKENPSQSITLGFRAKVVFVWSPWASSDSKSCGVTQAAAIDGQPYHNGSFPMLEITDTGFTVRNGLSLGGYMYYPDVNMNDHTYYYVAFR